MYSENTPAAYWLDQLSQWGPKVLFAIIILIATHFVAKAVQWAMKRLIEKIPVLKRDPDAGGDSVGRELGRLAYWLVWLVGLIMALNQLGLQDSLQPLERLTNEVFSFLPNLLGAVVIFFAGLILARIVRHVVEAALGALNIEKLAGRAGLNIGEAPVAVDSDGNAGEGAAPARSSIAHAVGLTISALIIIFASIAALQALKITAISDPATRMLEVIASAIPVVIGALLLLAIFFVLAKWAKSLIEAVLPSLGFDRFIHALGVMPATAQPSRIVGGIAFIALLVAGLMQAAAWLGGDMVAIMLLQITELGGKVIFGTVIIVAGLFLARILSNIVGDSTGEGSFADTIVKYAIIVLFTAIGLTFMGLADQIVMLAFGLILGSAAVAAALAFGLGGRDVAARMLEEFRANNDMPPMRPTPPKRLKKVAPEDDGQPPLV
ncbi:mechanosensitive ion channel [Sphingomicrobium flavum]|uniref:mechanosensitive ion channel n=1 Tax=Sphingomicrobium flavum TaxID=1229164 RepID=UPI0021ADBA8B|nr:mechanosensitive ion channel [Sphingomicrobium flavum]